MLPALALALLCAGGAWAGERYEEIVRTPVAVRGPVLALAWGRDEVLFVGSGRGAFVVSDGVARATSLDEAVVGVVAEEGGESAVVLTGLGALARVDSAAHVTALPEVLEGRARSLVATSRGPLALVERLAAASPDGTRAFAAEGDRLVEINVATGTTRERRLPGRARSLSADASGPLVALETGGVLGLDAKLPCSRVDALAPGWTGSVHGAFDVANRRVYAGGRWLSDDRVRVIVPDGRGGAAIGTDAGLDLIVIWEGGSLAGKARRFQSEIQRHHLRQGLVNPRHVERGPEPTDNDGLWTAIWAASQCERFATTGEARARENAKAALRALARLEQITGIPGFPARSIIAAEDWPPRDGVWRKTPDGRFLWKTGTSSDELVGHFFAYHHAWRTVCKDDPELRDLVRGVVARIAGHIVDHGFTLVGEDGTPTRWGVWSPEKLNDDPAWRVDRGLNSLELLSHLAVAREITGDERFERAARKLIDDHGYLENVRRVKWTGRFQVNHSDDQLAFLSWGPLLDLERDPARRAAYLEGFARDLAIERPEANPLFTYLARAAAPELVTDEDLARARRTLEEIPLDLREWPMSNSWREDVERAPDLDRFGRPQSRRVLSPRERALMRWNGNPYLLDGGGDPAWIEEGSFFLLPYWLGRAAGVLPGPP
jgi:hypothetical protein